MGTSRVLRQADLDAFGCDLCGPSCRTPHRIYFRARCHPRARLYACYERGTAEGEGRPPSPVGFLILECPVCEREVARVAVAV